MMDDTMHCLFCQVTKPLGWADRPGSHVIHKPQHCGLLSTHMSLCVEQDHAQHVWGVHFLAASSIQLHFLAGLKKLLENGLATHAEHDLAFKTDIRLLSWLSL